MAVPTYRSVGSAQSSAALPDMTIPQPAGLVAGDLLLLISAASGAGTQINGYPTSGWTSLGVQAGGTTVTGAESGQMAWKIADASDVALANPNFTWSAAVAKVGMLIAISGVHGTLPVNTSARVAVNNSTAYDAPSVTPTVAETLLICAVGSRASSAVITSTAVTIPTGGYLGRSNQTAGFGYKNGPAAGVASGLNRLTYSISDGGFAYTVAVAPPSTDVTPPAAPTGLTVEMSEA